MRAKHPDPSASLQYATIALYLSPIRRFHLDTCAAEGLTLFWYDPLGFHLDLAHRCDTALALAPLHGEVSRRSIAVPCVPLGFGAICTPPPSSSALQL